MTADTCSICSEGTDWVGVGVGTGVICGCHATLADTKAGRNSGSDADNLILIAVRV